MITGKSGGLYGERFYSEARQDGSRRSARRILSWLLPMVAARSAADVGCGTGTWLAVCRELGVNDVLGLDGPWVPRDRLAIPPECFKETDLRQPFAVPRRFDLALSLEVGEHLPQDCARGFIESLAKLAQVVLFSAAVPGQSGTGHVNEQWPAFWEELFAECGFQAVDCVREQFWEDDAVEPWYIQNALLYVQRSALAQYPGLAADARVGSHVRALVHPRLFLGRVAELSDARNYSLRRIIKVAPFLTWRALAMRVRKKTKALR
ncbi:MAG TPA: methyltransferase domain-containing protein [Anaerolineae bacterium]|nr:methyltransferase domain-containing protein [Anaerolineae bacterium]